MKGLIYYTDNHAPQDLLQACRRNLWKCVPGFEVISVSSEPLDFGRNITMNHIPRSPLQIFKKILTGLEAIDSEIVFLVEHDIIYHSSHFDFIPPKKDVFYYNRNRWAVDPDTGKGVFYQTNTISLLVAYKDLLLEHWKRRVELTERDGFQRKLGYSPPKGLPREERKKYKTYMSEWPCLDVRHNQTYTRKRMSKSQFRSERGCRGWTESYDIPYWGKLLPWEDFLKKL